MKWALSLGSSVHSHAAFVLVDTELLTYAQAKATNKRLRSNGRTTFRARPRSSSSECVNALSQCLR